MLYKGIEFKKDSNPEQSVLDALSDNQLHDFEVAINTLGIAYITKLVSKLSNDALSAFRRANALYTREYGETTGEMVVAAIDKLSKYQRWRDSIWGKLFGYSDEKVSDLVADMLPDCENKLRDAQKQALQTCEDWKSVITDGYIYKVILEKHLGNTSVTQEICPDKDFFEFVDFCNSTEDSLMLIPRKIRDIYNLVVYEGKSLDDLSSKPDFAYIFSIYKLMTLYRKLL